MPAKKRVTSKSQVLQQAKPKTLKAKSPKTKTSRKKPVSSTAVSTFPKKNPMALRLVIEAIQPQIDNGAFPIKRVMGEDVTVSADIFSDGHDALGAAVLYRAKSQEDWREARMRQGVNDRWEGSFQVPRFEDYVYKVQAWVDPFITWREKIRKYHEAGKNIAVELAMGASLLLDAAERAPAPASATLRKWARDFQTDKKASANMAVVLGEALEIFMSDYGMRQSVTIYEKPLEIRVDRKKALFSAWYEFFPRSWSSDGRRHGTLKDAEALLPEISAMGFDVVYLPPVHPIGQAKRKGRNNSAQPEKNDVGSPWAIGAKAGGHKSIHPDLGTLADFKHFVTAAAKAGLEVALDIAFQCSPDHPYVKEHPEWFTWRPDGTVQHAENPPKKYEDIYPINFETEDRENLWHELKSIFMFWIEQGVRIFRVDNPHTKPFAFWDWVIAEIRKDYPDVLFLSEAFTRPKVMARLAKGGFHQSYTYFTWRTSAWDLKTYLTELTQTEMREYFRPNFWPNTPDILPWHLQQGGRPAFMARLVLAATLSSNYGIYGPAYELCVAESVPGKEEYLHSEKYELKKWDRQAPWSLRDFIARVNRIRKSNPALQTTWNLRFLAVNNENLLCFLKATPDLSNVLLIAVNLDPFVTQSGWVQVPVWDLDLNPHGTYKAHDLISNDWYTWYGEYNYIELNPFHCPAHILHLIKDS